MRSADRAAGWSAVRRVVGVALAFGCFVLFARSARGEVRYERPPTEPAPEQRQALAQASAGTACGGWPQMVDPSTAPVLPGGAVAVWASAEAFHVQSSSMFVQQVRVEVRDGTARTSDLDARPTLDVPLARGGPVDITISCEASGVSFHLLNAQGEEVTDHFAMVGSVPTTPPVDVSKSDVPIPPPGCTDLALAELQLVSARGAAAKEAAVRHLAGAGQAFVRLTRAPVRERGDLDLLVEAARVWAEQGGTATFLDLRRLDDAETKVFHRVVDITTAHCR